MAAGIKAPKKLIEVALPLDDINEAAAREKSIRHGHPSTLHLWWARRPLAAARAVLFAQMVNDPGGERGWYKGKTKAQADAEREALFDLIRELVQWENTTNETVLERAREAIRRSWRETCEANKDHPRATELFDPEKLPAFHDPFAGGGAIPLEAQRLGLEAHASDLNPVAVLINKAMIEVPPRFAGRRPVGPLPPGEKQAQLDHDWPGATGLAEDVRRYGRWMRDEAEKRIGHLYPKIEVTAEMARERKDLKPYVGRQLTVIAWLWARTVKSPNPAFAHVDVPLASTFMLSKKGEEAYVEPVIEGDGYRFTVKVGTRKNPESAETGTKLSRGANFQCLMSGTPIAGDYIKAEGKAGRMGVRLMAIVAEGDRGRVYLAPTREHEAAAHQARPEWKPEVLISGSTQYLGVKPYGMNRFDQLFTDRQLVALTTFSDLLGEAMERVKRDALAAGMADDGKPLRDGGAGAMGYGEAVELYLAFALSKVANIGSSLASWMNDRGAFRETFARQALPMVWDFAEANPFADAGGSMGTALNKGAMVLAFLPHGGPAVAVQADARTQAISTGKVISTDPPYFDNVPYADLSDFFYVWLRRSLRSLFPNLLATLAVPKSEELVAFAYRHEGGKVSAEAFFLEGMSQAMQRLNEQSHPTYPVTIYYAFKQAETNVETGTASTGWETFLDAVIHAGFTTTGTWPIRTEGSGRIRATSSNALASSIILVCRRRDPKAITVSRRDFQRELRDEMPEALETMIGGKGGASPIAPVDLAQAAIGPGMAIFSRYTAVQQADGSPMSVHDALVMINKEVDDFLNPSGAGFDADTQFCSAWFAQYGWASGKFGDADVLARAKGTSVDGVAESGVIQSGGGKVRLLKWEEYPDSWDPTHDNRTPVWEACHHLIRALNRQGESEAGRLLARMPERAEPIRQLAYHLYTVCERKKWADDARAYNELITAWHGIVEASHEVGHVGSQQALDF